MFGAHFLILHSLLNTLYKCVALCRAVCGHSATKRPLELFVKRGEFLPGSGFLSRCDMTLAVEKTIRIFTFITG